MDKLRLTRDDMYNLPERALNRLMQWWVPRNNDDVLAKRFLKDMPKISDIEFDYARTKKPVSELRYAMGMSDEQIKQYYIPMLSISRLLDFLNGKILDSENNEFSGIRYEHDKHKWIVLVGNKDSKYTAVRCCDALWLAVRDYLDDDTKPLN